MTFQNNYLFFCTKRSFFLDKNIKNELKRILEGLSFLVKKYRKDTIKFHTSYPLRCLILPLFYQKNQTTTYLS